MKRHIQEALNGPHGKQTMIDRFIAMINDARTLYQTTGISIFKDPEDMDTETIESIAEDFDNRVNTLPNGSKNYTKANVWLKSQFNINAENGEDDIFVDTEAREFAMSRIEGRPIQGSNKYSDALMEYRKVGMIQAANDRQQAKLLKKSKSEQRAAQSGKEKEKHFAEMNKMLDLDAVNFYWNVKSSPYDLRKNLPKGFNIDDLDKSIEEINALLMPYFQQEPEYSAYMKIKNVCTHISKYANSNIIDPNAICTKRLYFDGSAIMIERNQEDVKAEKPPIDKKTKKYKYPSKVVGDFHERLFNSLNNYFNIQGVKISNEFHIYKYDDFFYVGKDVTFVTKPIQAQNKVQQQPSVELYYATDIDEKEIELIEDILNKFNAQYEIDEGTQEVIFTVDSKYKNDFEKYLTSNDIEFEQFEYEDDDNINENMRKQTIHLTESHLRDIINESVIQILNENALKEGAMMDRMKMMWNVIKQHPQESFAALVSAGLLAATIATTNNYVDPDYQDGHGQEVFDNGQSVGHMQSYDEIQRDLNNY